MLTLFYILFLYQVVFTEANEWLLISSCVCILLLLFVLLRQKCIAQSREMAQDMSQKREDLTYKERNVASVHLL